MSLETRREQIDAILREFATELSTGPEYWLLIQTILTSQSTRAFVDSLALQASGRVLDIGSGFGALAFDLAARCACDVTACDSRESTLAVAQRMQDKLTTAGAFAAGSHVSHVSADAYALPFEDGQFDLVVSRFLLQHLENPVSAIKEMLRVVRPGGTCVIVDIDDQTIMTYPVLSSAFSELHGCLAKLQRSKGGDREIGRKLPLMLRRAGFRDVQIEIRPQAGMSFVEDNDLSLQYSLLRFAQLRDEIVAAGIIASSDFDRHFEQLKTETGYWQFSANAEFVVSGVK